MPTQRFLTLDDVAEILNVSWSQAYALVRRGELAAIQIGGRGQWRIEADQLERFIQRKYAEARAGTVPDEPDAEDVGGADPQGSAEPQDGTKAEDGAAGAAASAAAGDAAGTRSGIRGSGRRRRI